MQDFFIAGRKVSTIIARLFLQTLLQKDFSFAL